MKEFEHDSTKYQTMVKQSSSGVTLRVATLEDEEHLKKWLQNPVDSTWAIGHEPFQHEDFMAWWGAEDQRLFILESPSGPVGYGEIWVDEDGGDVELAHLLVAPDQRGNGLGKALVDLLFAEACKTGFPHVYMRVNPANERALACYKGVGFAELKELPDGWPADYVWMRRTVEK